LRSTKVNIGRRDVVQALVVTLVIVVIDEGFNLDLSHSGGAIKQRALAVVGFFQ